jgi:hypothetical protein
MQIHGRAKLGPAGRLALCQAIEGLYVQAGRGCDGRLAGGGPSVIMHASLSW